MWKAGRLWTCWRWNTIQCSWLRTCIYLRIYIYIYIYRLSYPSHFKKIIILIKSYWWSGTANRCRGSNLIIANLTLIRMNVCWEISFTVSQGHIRFVFSFGQVQRFIKVFVNEVILRAFLAVYIPTWWHANQMNL